MYISCSVIMSCIRHATQGDKKKNILITQLTFRQGPTRGPEDGGPSTY